MALILSWVVAVVFTPYLGVLLLPKNLAAGTHHDVYDRPVYHRLRSVVDWAVQHRAWVLALTVLVFAIAGAGMLKVQQQFFPTASRPELLVELRLREGASFAATERQVKLLEARLAKDPDIEFFTAYTGAGTPRFYLSIQPELPNPGFAQFVVKTAGIEQRERVRARLMELFDKDEALPDVKARVQRLEFGPPVGFPVQFRVIGPDKAQVREIAYRVRDTVRQSPLVRDTQLDWNEQVRSVQVHVDQDKARLLGLSSADIQGLVQTTLDGAPVTQIRRGEELVDVVVRATPEERKSIGQLGDLQVFTRSGVTVPLSQLARVEPAFEEPVLWRRNRDMALTVRSDVVDGVQGPYATAQIRPSLQPIVDSLPAGYRIEEGGAIEESDKANEALFAVFPAMFAVMLTLLMIQLQSFSRLFMVFMTAPLALIGVVPALLLFQAPFGFVALLGVIALGGMIMRNSIILVDQIDQDIARGVAPWTAIVDATVRRSRPVVLTAAAAVLAMIPLTRSVFWGPMAISIMGGLVVATALTLVFVPALYAAWFRIRRDSPAQAPAAAPLAGRRATSGRGVPCLIAPTPPGTDASRRGLESCWTRHWPCSSRRASLLRVQKTLRRAPASPRQRCTSTFASKEDLLKALIAERFASRIAIDAHETTDARASQDLLRDVLTTWRSALMEGDAGGIFKLVLTEVRNFPGLADFWSHEVIEPARRLVSRIVVRGIDRGEFRPVDPDLVVHALVLPIIVMCLHRHAMRPSVPNDSLMNAPDLFSRHFELVLEGLIHPPPVRAPATSASS